MPEDRLSPQEAAMGSQETQASEKAALRQAQETAEESILHPRKVGDDDVMDALDALRIAQGESHQFAQEHIGPLVDAALHEAVERESNL